MDDNNKNEAHLETTNVPEVNFEGVKLSIDGENSPRPPDTVRTIPGDTGEGDRDGLLRRTGSIRGKPVTEPLPEVIQDGFFAGKGGRLEDAVRNCQGGIVDNQLDGQVHGVWLLTEVDHWDNEKERLMMITERSLLDVKYDFVSAKPKDCQRIPFKVIDKIQKGLFEYPYSTLATPRDGAGVRIMWGNGRIPTFTEKWNPFCSTIPYITITNHPLEHQNETRKASYQVEPFLVALMQAINNFRQLENPSSKLVEAYERPIQTEIYLGLHSTIFNQSRLGFFRERGGISF